MGDVEGAKGEEMELLRLANSSDPADRDKFYKLTRQYAHPGKKEVLDKVVKDLLSKTKKDQTRNKSIWSRIWGTIKWCFRCE